MVLWGYTSIEWPKCLSNVNVMSYWSGWFDLKVQSQTNSLPVFCAFLRQVHSIRLNPICQQVQSSLHVVLWKEKEKCIHNAKSEAYFLKRLNCALYNFYGRFLFYGKQAASELFKFCRFYILNQREDFPEKLPHLQNHMNESNSQTDKDSQCSHEFSKVHRGLNTG